MQLVSLTPEAFTAAYPQVPHVFASVPFALLNAPKADAVELLSMVDGNKHRLGIAVGRRGEQWLCPWSAPFGGVVYRDTPSQETVSAFFDLMQQRMGPGGWRLTLPPHFYNPAVQPKLVYEASRHCRRQICDINYHFDCSANYDSLLDHDARKNLRRALEAGFTAKWSTDPTTAYEVIRINRAERGHPLRMTLQQVLDTTESVVKCECLTLSRDGRDAAAAVVFHVAKGIVQVIYWGNIVEYSPLRPMNLLAREVFMHFASQGIRIIDVGQSSSEGEPNPGLCRFKESVGCLSTVKPTFLL